MMKQFIGLLFLLFFFTAGVVSCLGAYRRWKWLVDPPEELWPAYSQAFIRRVFGEKFTIGFTYFLGIMLMICATIGLMNSCRQTDFATKYFIR